MRSRLTLLCLRAFDARSLSASWAVCSRGRCPQRLKRLAGVMKQDAATSGKSGRCQ